MRTLMASSEQEKRALAAYIRGLIDKASEAGPGLSKRKLAKCTNICYVKSQLELQSSEHILRLHERHVELLTHVGYLRSRRSLVHLRFSGHNFSTLRLCVSNDPAVRLR